MIADITVTVYESSWADDAEEVIHSFTSTYEEFWNDGGDESPAAWVVSELQRVYCYQPSDCPTVNTHTWYSAEPYTHPADGTVEETSAHMSGAGWTRELAELVATLVKS